MYRSSMAIAALGLVVACAGVGCSSFRHDKRVALRQPVPHTPIEGIWYGEWADLRKPKHGGDVTAVLTKTGDQLYRFAARSEWWGFLTSAYDTPLVITPAAPGEYLIQGDKSLWLFGTYSVTGRVDAASMELVYQVGEHTGRMSLRRGPEAATAAAPTAAAQATVDSPEIL